MCRNIKTLYNFDPPATEAEIHAAALQFVRKLSGFNKPSQANEAAFYAAVDDIAAISSRLLHALETNAPPKNREAEAAKAKARTARRLLTSNGRRASWSRVAPQVPAEPNAMSQPTPASTVSPDP